MKSNNRTIVIDVDSTICLSPEIPGDYGNAQPIVSMIERVRQFKTQGFYITLYSSRQMRTYEGNLGLINANTLPVMVSWLEKHSIPYDEIYLGKPWCGKEGFYVDDRAIRPIEFLTKSIDEIKNLLEQDANLLNMRNGQVEGE
ncbi:capsular biosynthesis protein [Paenibacillus turpanensis]|uniref:capsular biosynthesis protein n=1 Tax=Paenibacillus turpanensis TaxID=2689078 RepID=UPI00140BE84A|nr:capsular biosynthesis protein [Paenibacillus turpanensis]